MIDPPNATKTLVEKGESKRHNPQTQKAVFLDGKKNAIIATAIIRYIVLCVPALRIAKQIAGNNLNQFRRHSGLMKDNAINIREVAIPFLIPLVAYPQKEKAVNKKKIAKVK